ncbi:MAG: hypothetical protein J7L38_00400, partial [Thermoproteales archaeon]|nr:hypothetical protein [Thermoproteales archaeon]
HYGEPSYSHLEYLDDVLKSVEDRIVNVRSIPEQRKKRVREFEHLDEFDIVIISDVRSENVDFEALRHYIEESVKLWGKKLVFSVLPSLICLPYILRNPWKKRWAREYEAFSKEIRPLIEEIHKELSEVYRLKLRPEVVEYKIVTEFSLREGGVVVKCPYCGGSLDLVKDKIEGNRYKCPYCGKFIVLPEKILSLL